MEKLELFGHTDENGKFHLHNLQRFEEWARTYPGKDVVVKFERKSSKRSDPQNKYYWGVVVREITVRLREMGHQWINDEDCHEFLKLKFNYEIITGEGGEIMEIPKSTANLNKTQFGEFVDTVRMWAADFLGINIPDPNCQTSLTL